LPLPTPFHPRTSALCTSYRWKEWAGYHAVCSYGGHHDPEYHAIRQTAGLLDITPLVKLHVHGRDATEFMAWMTARDTRRLKVGQVGYGCFCDGAGKVLDDGTVTRLDDSSYRVTSADPGWGWMMRNAEGFDVRIDEVTDDIAALALQGPKARDILVDVMGGDIGDLGFFRHAHGAVAGAPIEVTRTGYTGDLGYELWMANEHALHVYDALVEAGLPHGIHPLGLDALDVSRVEAGFILMGVDYFSARHALVPAQMSSPYEIGLGWTVHLKNHDFLGRAALAEEKAKGSPWAMVGLVADWEEIEELFDAEGLPPSLPAGAWRSPIPVYLDDGRQVGQATSGAWSPMLKQNLALATVKSAHAAPGTRLRLELTVEFRRRTVGAVVTETPFFDPERKRS